VDNVGTVGVRRLEAIVHGRVQGVGFRAWVVKGARALNVTGYVRNLSDRRQVEVVAEGRDADLDRLVDALHKGPWIARVERVDANRFPARGDCADFDIRT
jgi:acylphosphatase